jgi:hypothetical protein
VAVMGEEVREPGSYESRWTRWVGKAQVR